MVDIVALQLKYLGTKKETIEHTAKLIEKNRDADLIILPELHQSEYFCKSIDEKFFSYSDSYNDDIEFWSNLAKSHNVVLVTSLFEPTHIGTYYNTAVVFESDGSIAGKYRKMHIPNDRGFYEKFYFTPGENEFKPIKTSIGNLGILICWDQWFSEASRVMTINGADILIYPTAIGYIKEDSKLDHNRYLNGWKTVQCAHSIENSIPVVAVNRVGIELDESCEKNNITFWGNSFITDQFGQIVTEAKEIPMQLKAKVDFSLNRSIKKVWPFYRDRRVNYYKDILKK